MLHTTCAGTAKGSAATPPASLPPPVLQSWETRSQFRGLLTGSFELLQDNTAVGTSQAAMVSSGQKRRCFPAPGRLQCQPQVFPVSACMPPSGVPHVCTLVCTATAGLLCMVSVPEQVVRRGSGASAWISRHPRCCPPAAAQANCGCDGGRELAGPALTRRNGNVNQPHLRARQPHPIFLPRPAGGRSPPLCASPCALASPTALPSGPES